TACYGAWLAGIVAVPLNVQARARDLAPWLAHCGASLVVHGAGNADVAEALAALPAGPSTLEVDAGACPWPSAPPGPAAIPREDTQPATILYTSGTTGAPKGVTLSHRNLAANVAAVIDYLELAASDVVLSVLPFYYAYGHRSCTRTSPPARASCSRPTCSSRAWWPSRSRATARPASPASPPRSRCCWTGATSRHTTSARCAT